MIEPTGTLLAEIRNPAATRDQVADSYSLAIRYRHADTDWAVVNRAIMNRWSISGLRYIKHRAWKIAENPDEPGEPNDDGSPDDRTPSLESQRRDALRR